MSTVIASPVTEKAIREMASFMDFLKCKVKETDSGLEILNEGGASFTLEEFRVNAEYVVTDLVSPPFSPRQVEALQDESVLAGFYKKTAEELRKP